MVCCNHDDGGDDEEEARRGVREVGERQQQKSALNYLQKQHALNLLQQYAIFLCDLDFENV